MNVEAYVSYVNSLVKLLYSLNLYFYSMKLSSKFYFGTANQAFVDLKRICA